MKRLVIIEDEHWTRELVKQWVKEAKLQIEIVGEAENGEDGLRLIKELDPDIVITDMNMPLMDGAQMLHHLEQWEKPIQIMVLSGYDHFQYTRQAIRSGAAEYLLKPVDPLELKHALELCIQKIKQSQQQNPIAGTTVQLPGEAIFILAGCKRRLSVLFTENEFEPIKQELEACLGKLEAAFPQCTAEQWRRIYSELTLHLEVIIAADSVEETHEIKEILEQINRLSFEGHSEEAARAISGFYYKTLAILADRRKNRKKLNMAVIQEFILNHYAEPLTLELLANRFFVSREYLSKAYKQQYKENLMDYLLRLRMEKAWKLIEDSRLQIKTIAQAVGYKDVSYFHKVFKKYYDISPMSIRKP
ncbi:response regulator [Cohnella cellulosilytica]|uniref:Response regulator n=1 Tax=Cohnella cellulosilytica TaxID=986710 RepID=A0ABW2F8E8_9BACL